MQDQRLLAEAHCLILVPVQRMPPTNKWRQAVEIKDFQRITERIGQSGEQIIAIDGCRLII